MYQLKVVRRAAIMAREAYEWYEEQKPGLGELFLTEVEFAFKKISRDPAIYSKIKKDYRQVLLRTFPYVVVFEILNDVVVVLAVFHTIRSIRKKFTK